MKNHNKQKNQQEEYCPINYNEYLHRAGRTARGNESGTCISLVTSKDKSYIKGYEKKFKINITKKSLKNGKLV